MTTLTTDPLGLAPPEVSPLVWHAARAILNIAEASGLPFPKISEDRAVFYFVGAKDADEARRGILNAETVLSDALNTGFATRYPEPVGSTRHVVRTAKLPSGLKVELVALAEHVEASFLVTGATA